MEIIYLKTVVITFLETSKLVGLIMSGWNVTFWPSVNMQHCPARLQWDNLLGHPDHRAWHQYRVWWQIQILSCSRKSVSNTHKMKIKTYGCNHHMHRMFGYSQIKRSWGAMGKSSKTGILQELNPSVSILAATNSHDSQIPIGVAASGSRDWSAEQQLT